MGVEYSAFRQVVALAGWPTPIAARSAYGLTSVSGEPTSVARPVLALAGRAVVAGAPLSARIE